ncbi:S9 family peptidase [Nonomuraea indica]|uniref:S9 family peptidase n=1 Tax=Nonomuraea indica TaxID=1581193 RepID=UPI000C7D3B9F|nr:alpha/beta fold hydrolase [Nonomuraea indica]
MARSPADPLLRTRPDVAPAVVWSCRAPALAPDLGAVAYVSDRGGSPRAWIGPLRGGGPARPLDTGPEPVIDVSWAPTGARLAVLVAPGGGEHTQVWTVRADGGGLRPLAAPEGGSAVFVRWTGRGETLLVAETSASGWTDAVLADAATGGREVVAGGELLRPAAVSRDHATLLVRRGPRGARRMSLAGSSREGGLASGLAGGLPGGLVGGLPGGGGIAGERELLAGLAGSTDYGILSPDGATAYLLSDAGRDRAALVAVPRDGAPVVLAGRADADLDRFALDPEGRRAVLVWNVAGRSELELLDTATGAVTPLPPPPADVVTEIRVSLDGSHAVLAAESPGDPPHVLLCELGAGRYERVAGAGPLPGAARAELVRLRARDGLELSAWLHRPPGVHAPAPYLVHLHGGPEDQERPTFNPLYQSLLAAGIGVFAPNVRGSGGFGRAFREADDRGLRFRAIDDVADCAAELVRLGVADPGRLACMGWSYGGYLTLAALVHHPGLFRTGVDVCGISDFESFYARTEPWIAAAAVGEYGHPKADRDLLRALSPLRRFDRLSVPLLVVHGARDTNVPVHQAEQAVEAARARGVPCDYLLFPDEGHEIRRLANRVAFVDKVVGWLGRHLLAPAAA